MSKRYLDVSSLSRSVTTGAIASSPSWTTSTASSTAPHNHMDIQGTLKIQDQTITGSDVKELKMMLDFLRHVIATDTHMSELWVAYKAKEKILR
jgi:hypothetical protein